MCSAALGYLDHLAVPRHRMVVAMRTRHILGLNHSHKLEPIPEPIRQKAGNTMGRPPVHHRADPRTYTFTHTKGQFSISSLRVHVFEQQEAVLEDTGYTCKVHAGVRPSQEGHSWDTSHAGHQRSPLGVCGALMSVPASVRASSALINLCVFQNTPSVLDS